MAFTNENTTKSGVILLVLAGLFISAVLAGDQPARSDVVVVEIRGQIDPGLAYYVERAVTEAQEHDPRLIIFEVDTWGGRVDSAIEISKTITDIQGAKTAAFVVKKAISAGALISLSCNDVFMKPDTKIGDCAPIAVTQEGVVELGEKYKTMLRAHFRNLAERNGYPVKLSESMVDKEMEIYVIRRNDRNEYVDRRELEEIIQKMYKTFESKVRFEENKAVLRDGNELTDMEKAVFENMTSKADKLKSLEDISNFIKQDIEHRIEKKTVVEKGKLLTIFSKEAVDLGFAESIVESRQAIIEKYLDDFKGDVTEINISWSEDLVRVIDMYAGLILLVALACIYIEIKSPGLGVPGLIGGVLLAVFFGSHYLLGLADVIDIVLFVLGVVLICLEIFVIPGFGIAGISGILLVGVSIVFSQQTFYLPNPDYPWDKDVFIQNLGSLAVSMVGMFFVMYLLQKYLPSIPIFGRIVLKSPSGAEVQAAVSQKRNPNAIPDESDLCGRKGVAVSHLRPAGIARIQKKRVDVVTRGEMIEKGEAVVVINVQGNRIIVKKVDQ